MPPTSVTPRIGGRLVSVVIPAHDAAETLRRALDSVFAQTYRPLDVIVVDDCSRDDTCAIAQSYAEQGARLVRLNRHLGVSVARNTGIAAALGDLVAFLDADDEWLPHKLARQVPLLEADAGMVLTSCASTLVAADGSEQGDVYIGRRPAWGDEAWRTLLAYNFIATPSVVARRQALLGVGGFDPALPVGEDQDMWIKLSMRGRLGYVPQQLVRVHVSPHGLSSADIHKHLQITIPMILRHLEARRTDLSQTQRRVILGERLARIGRTALGRNHYADGARLLLRAAALGYRPLANVALVLRASPPAHWLKAHLPKLS